MTEHIQINDVAPRVQYLADGIQSAFTFPFGIFRFADLEVWQDEILQTGGYSVSGAGVSTGGVALFAVPPAAGTRITLRRRLCIARTTDYQTDGLIRAKTLNDELDYQVAALQQVAEGVERAVRRAPTSAAATDLTLPEPVAGKAIGWNVDGTGLTNDPAEFASAVANVTAQAGIATAQAGIATTQAGIATTQAGNAGISAAAALASANAAQAYAAAAADMAKVEWKGPWSEAAAYALHDAVGHDGSSWICIQAHTNQPPADNAYWYPLAVKGVDGFGSGDMLTANNLSDLASVSAARTHLDVYSMDETDAAIAAAGVSAAVHDRLAFLEKNLALNTLRDQIDAGWSVLNMVDGVADEFEDETGVATNTNGTYDAAGDYYHNPETGYGADVTAAAYAISDGSWAASVAVMFDGDAGTGIQSNNAAGSTAGNVWVGQDFGDGNERHIRRVTIHQSNSLREITSVKVQSADTGGGPWGDVTTASIALGANTINLPASSAKRCWRVLANANQADGYGWWIDEIQMMEASGAPDMTLVSVAVTAEAVPAEVRMVLLHEPVVATTLNTDCVIEASRDDGVTWTAGSLSDDGAFDASTNILSATIDLSAQPAGLMVKWRFKTLNGKTQRLHGAWMQWR